MFLWDKNIVDTIQNIYVSLPIPMFFLYITRDTMTYDVFILFFFPNGERESAHEHRRGTESERENLKYASCSTWSRVWGLISGPWDYNLNQIKNQKLNLLSHPSSLIYSFFYVSLLSIFCHYNNVTMNMIVLVSLGILFWVFFRNSEDLNFQIRNIKC